MREEDGFSMSQVMFSAPSVLAAPLARRGAAVAQWQPGVAKRQSKIIQDPVYGLIRLNAACIDIMDSQPFQRLRDLKQLGTTHFVFPSATHTRFEHSLGVAHKAHELAYQIYQGQGAELGITSTDVRTVELAGLCHDLGHGPFSHVFDSEFLRRKGIHDWSHEQMSADIVDLILGCIEEDKGRDYVDSFLPESQMKEVKDLILSAHQPQLRSAHEKKFLFDIVANGINGIDVDKFDYLARDSMHLAIPTSFNSSRILKYSKVIDNEICFKHTEYNSIGQLFYARAHMHNEVYTHAKSKAVEFMIVDALLEADHVMGFSSAIRSAADFVHLDDSLLRHIEEYHHLTRRNIDAEELAPMRRAQHVCRRLRKRDIYAFAREVTIPPCYDDDWQEPSAADVVSCYNGPVKLREEDVIISIRKVNFGMGRKNPLDAVRFFEHYDDTESFAMSKESSNSMMPQFFQDRKLRAFSRNSDPAHVEALREAFSTWVLKRFGGEVAASTPSKRRWAGDRAPGASKRKLEM